jgi:histidyl-tRNA synthetase
LYKAPRGTSDILPSEQPYWKYVKETAVFLCQLYGYQPLSTPITEDSRLFTRTVARGTDIIDKEMYIFKDRGGQELALRPEGTAPVCRAYLEHGLFNLPQPVRLYYIGVTFRYERPQAGRYRQHHQFGFEAIGDADPALDAEAIEMAQRFLLSLGLSEFSIHLNSIGCKLCRPRYIEVLKRHYSGYEDSLCPDCKVRLARNPLRLLDCKNERCQEVAKIAPKTTDFLCRECQTHFHSLQDYLNTLDIPFQLDHRLVRGLDYYTRTVFEIQPRKETPQGALGGGGRYDDLIEELGGKPTPAVGFAAGIERVILNLKEQEINIPPLPKAAVFIAYLGKEAKNEAIKLASALREAGIATIGAVGDKSLKAQLKQADSWGSSYTIIIGKEEMKNQSALLRSMKSGEQKTIPLSQVVAMLKKT